MRVIRLMPVLALLLVACSDERASFMANGQQSLTAIVRQQWLWTTPRLYVVVRGEPTCQREYFLQEMPDRSGPFEIYAWEATTYALVAGQQKYLFDVGNCEITRYKDIPDLKPQDRLGQFSWTSERFDFLTASAAR